MSRIGRNDPCPCGSGKKYKKCCMVESVPPLGREDAIKKRLVQSLVDFAETRHKRSVKEAFEYYIGDPLTLDTLPPAHHRTLMINFMEWLVHDRVVEELSGKTLIDLYIEKTRLLAAEDLSILNRLKDAVLSLYEIQEHFPDEGFVLKDLIRGGVHKVSEIAATRTFMKWDVFAVRLMVLDGKEIIAGAVYPFHIGKKNELTGEVMNDYAEYIAEFPGSSMNDYLKAEAGPLFNEMWCDFFLNPEPIFLHNTSGDPLVISKALFDVTDEKHLREKLENSRDMERDEEVPDVYRWTGNTKSMENVTKGTITVSKGRLTLECNSKKRLTNGKKLLLKCLAGNIAHRADSFEDPAQLVDDIRLAQTPYEGDEEDILTDADQEFYTEFMDKHFHEWVSMSIPALGGQTPLQAIKSKSGKLKVVELLKQFENGEEHNRRVGKPYYDVSWLWGRLGLKND